MCNKISLWLNKMDFVRRKEVNHPTRQRDGRKELSSRTSLTRNFLWVSPLVRSPPPGSWSVVAPIPSETLLSWHLPHSTQTHAETDTGTVWSVEPAERDSPMSKHLPTIQHLPVPVTQGCKSFDTLSPQTHTSFFFLFSVSLSFRPS